MYIFFFFLNITFSFFLWNSFASVDDELKSFIKKKKKKVFNYLYDVNIDLTGKNIIRVYGERSRNIVLRIPRRRRAYKYIIFVIPHGGLSTLL